MLIDSGYRRVRPLEGGLEAWIESGGELQYFDEETGVRPRFSSGR
jgi:3-mercaptopyruvate sulfurtransferase SseA